MIQRHPKVEKLSFDRHINYYIQNKELYGHVSMEVLESIYNLFTWVYRGKSIKGAFKKEDDKITLLFSAFNLKSFVSDSITDSTIIFYNKLKALIDIRELSYGRINFEPVNNKLLIEKDFKITSLYNLYKESIYDIPISFLLFNNIFKVTQDKVITNIKSTGQVVSLLTYTDIVRPDFYYKLLKKNLLINDTTNEEDITNKIYIIQDCTLSMNNYIDKLKILKAYILDTALRFGWKVVWIEAFTSILSETEYKDKKDIIDIKFKFKGSSINYRDILKDKKFIDKKLVIVTDGTDNFNFNFSSISADTNLITFTENYNLKNKIGAYGKYYIF